MQDGQAEEQPKAAPAEIAGNAIAAQAGKAKKTPLEMSTVPTSIIKLHSLQKKENDEAKPKQAVSKTRERNESLEGPCGLGCIVIPRCQRLNNIQCFLVFFCILVISQGVAFGLVDLSIATFQKRNRLSTTEILLLSSTYDISSCLVVLFISYYGGRGNIPRWITFSSFLVGLSSLFFAFPYITDGHYQLPKDPEDICQEMKIINVCKKSSPSFQAKYIASFILGQTVLGIAGMPLFILAEIFVDNSVAIHSTGIYLATLGYSLGYVIGAPLIKGDENNVDDHHKWLRTWWIYFGFVSLTAWFTLIPLSCFPQSVRGTAKIKEEKRKQIRLLDEKFNDQKLGTSIKDFFATFWALMKNIPFLCLSLTRASESLVLIGASQFLPIYIENQFILTYATATKIAGFVLLPGGALGQLLGGIIVSKLHMSCKALMRFIVVTSVISLVFFGFVIFIHCETIPFAGINEDYDGTGQLGNLSAPCNSRCRCSSSLYSVICGRDHIGYFSPCFAGCTQSKTITGHKTYYNCSCIQEGLTTADDQGDFIDARAGTCDAKCHKLPLFIAFIFSTILFSVFSGIPITLSILRYKSLVEFIIIVFFTGTIPGPIAFKMGADISCTLRGTDNCGETGDCWIYNKTQMAYLMVGLLVPCNSKVNYPASLVYTEHGVKY
uniref:Solute carrier organic anion transporter family member 6A1 n=1 Tax=Suricata suricatta TaxID=37032 RepID=A0A673SRH2_SURSU